MDTINAIRPSHVASEACAIALIEGVDLYHWRHSSPLVCFSTEF